MELRRIMVAVKPWERGLPITANHARQLAQGTDAQIEIVGTVFDAAISARSDGGDARAYRTQSRAVAGARAGLERLASSMRDSCARVTTRVMWGVPPYDAILAAAQEWQADLLVVGVHEPGTPHTRLTDTDWQLMRRTRCPLLVVKGAAFSGYRTILAAVDPVGSNEQSNGIADAVSAASRCVARACGSTVRAVVLVESAPARTIINAAAHSRAELVVVGAPQRHGVAPAFIGSTAELVAGELPSDLLIVPLVEGAAGVRSKVG